MALKVWGEPYLTADASGTDIHSPLKFTRNVIIRAIRFRVIFNNNPALTSVGGRIFSDNGSTAPNVLIASSTDTRTKAELTTLGNGVVESFVTFNDLHWRKDTLCHFLLTLNGYTGTASSHMALERSYPDPVVKFTGFSFKDLVRSPFYVYPIVSVL